MIDKIIKSFHRGFLNESKRERKLVQVSCVNRMESETALSKLTPNLSNLSQSSFSLDGLLILVQKSQLKVIGTQAE